MKIAKEPNRKDERHSLVKLHLSKHCKARNEYRSWHTVFSNKGITCKTCALPLANAEKKSGKTHRTMWFKKPCSHMSCSSIHISSPKPMIRYPRSPYPPGIPKSVQINCIECLLATMSRQPLQFNHLTFSQWNEQHLHQIPQNVVAVAACDSFQFFLRQARTKSNPSNQSF